MQKRYLVKVAARNLGLLMRVLFGVGSPRSLQGLAAAALSAVHFALQAIRRLRLALGGLYADSRSHFCPAAMSRILMESVPQSVPSSMMGWTPPSICTRLMGRAQHKPPGRTCHANDHRC